MVGTTVMNIRGILEQVSEEVFFETLLNNCEKLESCFENIFS